MKHGAFLGLVLSLVGCPTPPAEMDAGPEPGMDAGLDAPGGDAASDASADGGSPAVRAALEAAGMIVADASFELIDISDCCEEGRSCSGNNPTSPYAALFLPRGPGQTVANPQELADGTAYSYRLREDEAIVVIGTTPPPAAYFGLTPYLMDRASGVDRVALFASLADTTNHAVLPLDAPEGAPPFEQPFAMVITAHAGTDATTRAALSAAGIAPRGTSTMALDGATLRMGLEGDDDTIGVLFRVAIWDDPTVGAAWLADPGWTVLRVSPTSPLPADPIALPPPRARDTSTTELALEPAVDRLEAAVRAANVGRTIRDVAVNDGVLDPAQCIAMERFCAGDNRDTIYPSTAPFRLDAGDSIYVLGVDHEATGKVTYASASLYAIDHLLGVDAVTSREWAGTGADWLPGDPDAENLFVWRMARDCGTDTACLEIPVGTCPDGTALDAALLIAFRAYLEPSTDTGPHPDTLVRERVLLVQAP